MSPQSEVHSLTGCERMRGSGFRRMRDLMRNHGLEQPVLGTDTGYFQVTFPGPGDNLDRIRVSKTQTLVTPAVEEQLNERQKKMVSLLVQTPSVRNHPIISRLCEGWWHGSSRSLYLCSAETRHKPAKPVTTKRARNPPNTPESRKGANFISRSKRLI